MSASHLLPPSLRHITFHSLHLLIPLFTVLFLLPSIPFRSLKRSFFTTLWGKYYYILVKPAQYFRGMIASSLQTCSAQNSPFTLYHLFSLALVKTYFWAWVISGYSNNKKHLHLLSFSSPLTRREGDFLRKWCFQWVET